MDRERVLRDQTVLVRDGLISEVGDARRVRVPAGALRIDGRGKYLLPGLADMHAHLFTDDGHIPAELAADRKSTRLNSSHANISYAVFCLRTETCRGSGRCARTAVAPRPHVAPPRRRPALAPAL